MNNLNTTYNRRKNRLIAGFVPIMIDNDCNENETSKSTGSVKSNKNVQILATTNSEQSACNLRESINQISILNRIPATIYQIDVAKACSSNIHLPTIKLSSEAPKKNGTTSKKTLRNKRQKEARRKRRMQRHVHFPEQEDLIAIVILIEDDEHVKEYRNKYWEFFAIDRNRFQHRVQRMSQTLERVLMPLHRAKIYKERFSSDESEEEKDSGCDSTNNDSDHGNELKKMMENKKKLTRPNVNKGETNGESGFEHEETDSGSECEANTDAISLSITLTTETLTSLHIYTAD